MIDIPKLTRDGITYQGKPLGFTNGVFNAVRHLEAVSRCIDSLSLRCSCAK